MSDPLEVPPTALLPRLAEELRKAGTVSPPAWAAFARTGAHTERAPTQVDWWYLRSASILRKLYTQGPSGISRLAAEYGGRRDRGSAPYHAVKGSRSIVQEILKQLEKGGFVTPVKLRGRALSAKGQSLVDKTAKEALKALADRDPALKKYL